MTRQWLRLDSGFESDGKLLRAGHRATSLWPRMLARLKLSDGVLTDEDLDPEVLAARCGEAVEWTTEAIGGIVRVGLLVRGSRSLHMGRGVYVEREGWIAPRWDDYQPDPRPAAPERRRSTPNNPDRSRLLPGSVREQRGTGRDGTGRDRTEEQTPSESCPEPAQAPSSGPASRDRDDEEALAALEGDDLAQTLLLSWPGNLLGKMETLIAWLDSARRAFPGIDLQAEAARAKAWEAANPKKRKRNVRRFLNNWWSTAQDDMGRNKSPHNGHRHPSAAADEPDYSNWPVGTADGVFLHGEKIR